MTSDTPQRRSADKFRPLWATLGIAVLVVCTVFSTVALVGVNSAQDAAEAAQDAAAKATRAINTAQRNTATLEDLCGIARQQREELRVGVETTEQYLASPVSGELPGFAGYIRQVSLPQARARLKGYTVPPSCAELSRPPG